MGSSRGRLYESMRGGFKRGGAAVRKGFVRECKGWLHERGCDKRLVSWGFVRGGSMLGGPGGAGSAEVAS